MPANDIPRTLVVANDFPPRFGGVQQYVYNLVSNLPPDKITVFAPRWAGWREHDEALPFRVVRYPGRHVVPLRDARERVLSLARETGAEVALLASGLPVMGHASTLRAAGMPSVVITHGVEFWAATLPGSRQMMHRWLEPASRVTVISDYIRRRVAPVVPAGVPVSLCPPGVDVERFNPSVSGAAIRERFGLGDRPVVVCVSRLVTRKGQDILIRAMTHIRRAHPEAVLIIVGEGSYRSKLESLAAEAPPGSVIFAGGVSADELSQFHASADVFAMPCRSRLGGLEVEGFGIVFMEAAATGKAVVAGNSGGAAEAVAHGETGLVVDGTDVGAVAAAVGELLSDPERARSMGVAGRQRAVEAYAWTEIASGVAGWLREAVG
jgi:phosphatidylinositol alpha-1,6-mannosyltransferase